MKKKALLSLLFLIICNPTLAEDLPQLPDIEDIKQDNSESLFQKILGFFSSDKKMQPPIITSKESTTNQIDDKPFEIDLGGNQLPSAIYKEDTLENDIQAILEKREDGISQQEEIPESNSVQTSSAQHIKDVVDQDTDNQSFAEHAPESITLSSDEALPPELAQQINTEDNNRKTVQELMRSLDKAQKMIAEDYATADDPELRDLSDEALESAEKEMAALRKSLKAEVSQVINNAKERSATLDQEYALNTEEQISVFSNNEAQILLLPNDDVVLGKLSENAQIEDTAFLLYVRVIKKAQEKLVDIAAKEENDRFIFQHYPDFYHTPQKHPTDEDIASAFSAVRKNDINTVRVLLDNYFIGNIIDEKHRTLLHTSVLANNYNMTKFLMIRGASLNIRDSKGRNPKDLAQKYADDKIVHLIFNSKKY